MHEVVTRHERNFQIVLAVVMVVIMLITVYPVWYSVINSLNDAQSIDRFGYSLLWMRKFSFASWWAVIRDNQIIRALGVTTARTVIVTVLQSIITAMFAYGFSRPNLTGRKWYTFLGFVSMYLNGGIIAYFILFVQLHIYNTFWVYILPFLFGGFYNVIIYNANFKAIPESLFESAKMDGASEYTIFFKIVIPLSKPVISALGIFTAVGMWNDYTQTLYYTQNEKLQTLSYYALTLTKSSQAASQLGNSMNTAAANTVGAAMQKSADFRTIELATMVLAALPLIIVYPFAQKFFEKGVMLGSVKG